MATSTASKVERRVETAAQAALDQQGFVSAIDVLVGMGWLNSVHVDQWRHGGLDHLEQMAAVNPDKLSAALEALRSWALAQGLQPSETDYLARTRDRRPLRFSARGDPAVERAYRTHWVSPSLSEAKRQRLSDKQSKAPDLVVIQPLKDWTCTECGGSGDLLIMEGPGPLCLDCADLGHLVFLPSGDSALTRRGKKASRLSAVVVRFSRSRGRYERQGVLIEEEALAAAEASCLADAEVRHRRRERDAAARPAQDEAFQATFASAISRLFPRCPAERAVEIAQHAGARGSGRVGRSAAGRALDDHAVTLAVAASVRHRDTVYDELLMNGVERADARASVRADVDRFLDSWKGATGPAS